MAFCLISAADLPLSSAFSASRAAVRPSEVSMSDKTA